MTSKLQDESIPKATQPSHVLPDNWPSDVTFITDYTYSDAVTPELRTGLSRPCTASEAWSKIPPEALESPCPRVKILTIGDQQHPAFGQRGLFAAQQLDPDAMIIVYKGLVHTNSMSDTDAHSDYDLALDRELGLSVDGARAGNESRFANDYRGIAERPNAEFRDCFVQTCSKRAEGVKWERRVGIYVLSAGKAGKRKAGIKAGDEVLVNYGKGYWEGRKTVASFRKDEEMLRIATLALDS
ncbi:hypothetical protein LTR08_005822 [Meristemomyces frigidus]|nr:hypothetical protein LTR08_005822 [Meristemomyces frigidus]